MSEVSSRDAVRSLRVVETDDAAAWDAFVETQPGSTMCHRSGWRDVLSDVLGHETSLLAAVDEGGNWRGVLPLVRVRSVLGHYLVSIPFMNDGGPLGTDDAKAALVEYAVADAKRTRVKLLELRSRDPVPGPVTPSERKVAVHLALPDTVEALWAATFKAKLRSQIRRPTKEGMIARNGVDQLDAFYSVFSRNMRDLGTPVLPRSFFTRLRAVFGDSVSFTAVYDAGGLAAAAACCLTWKDEVEVTWASSLRELNHLSPNMLLYANLMEQAIGRGLRTFNFGRSTPESPTHRFKLQWGGQDRPLAWPSWSPGGAASTPSPDRAAFRVATAVWRRLPMPVANRVGPLLSRHLP
ncbi:MAG TPA: FemAB family XrtA/PEP-CTERM system-associated protein [Gemmatimonadaceae bacterium]|nr:FemAB family XrtA/PEP-CTERM system-associated protein [Gemmatimonadaceae bacterium]